MTHSAPPRSYSLFRSNNLYRAVALALIVFSGSSSAVVIDGSTNNGEVDLTGRTITSSDDYAAVGWYYSSVSENQVIENGRVHAEGFNSTVGSSFGTQFMGSIAFFEYSDIGSVSSLNNTVNLSDFEATEESSVIIDIAGSWVSCNGYGFNDSKASVLAQGNSATISNFKNAKFLKIFGNSTLSHSYRGDASTQATITIQNNSANVFNSSGLTAEQTDPYGSDWGIVGGTLDTRESYSNTVFAKTIDISKNKVHIQNSDLEFSTSVEENAIVAGGQMFSQSNVSSIAAQNESVISLAGNSVLIEGEKSSITGDVSIYGALSRTEHGVDNGKTLSIKENFVQIQNNANVDANGLIVGGAMDYSHARLALITSSVENNFITISENSTVTSGQGIMAGGFAYAYNVNASKPFVEAKSPDVTVNSNYVISEQSQINSNIFGGFAFSQGGGLNKMNVWDTPSGQEIHDDAYHDDGLNGGDATAHSNNVTVTGGTVNGNIFGGYAVSEAMAGLFLTKVDSQIVSAGNVSASHNIVTVTDATVGQEFEIYGGYAGSYGVPADDAAYADYDVNGGEASASNNLVTISGGTVDSVVYGGFVDSVSQANGTTGTLSANNNVITLRDHAKMENASLNGSNLTAEQTIGNKLIVDGAIGQVGAVNNFNELTFQNLEWSDTESALIVKSGDLSKTDISINGSVAINGALPQGGSQMTVLEDAASGLGITEDNLVGPKDIALFNESTAAQGSATATVDESGNVVLKVGNAVTPTQQTALLAENRSVALSFASLTNDLIPEALQAIDNNEYGLKTFALVEGSAVEFDVNTDLKINGWYGLFGAGSSTRLGAGEMLNALFFEVGQGNYRTDNTFNQVSFEGDGKINNYALGTAIRYKLDNALYFDAGVKVGLLKTEMDNALMNINGDLFDMDSDTYYWSAHLGLGKVFSISEKNTLDLYGRYYYTYNEDDSYRVSIDRYEADAIKSHRVRLATRWTHEASEFYHGYVGLGFDYEFDGDVRMHVGDLDIPTQSSQGSTGFGEIGMKLKAKTMPVDIDMRFKGYAGQWQGVSGMVRATYTIK